jgi:hypothetical protein
VSPVIKLGGPRRFVVSDLLRDFEFAAVLQIRRNAGRTEGMIANPRFDAGWNGIPTLPRKSSLSLKRFPGQVPKRIRLQQLVQFKKTTTY